MALLEKEAVRFADSLDDYEHVSVTDIGGWGPNGFWVVVRDHRFDLDYEIASHCDYWDFIGALVDHKQYIGRTVPRPVPSECELEPQAQKKPLVSCVRSWVLVRRGRSAAEGENERVRVAKEVA